MKTKDQKELIFTALGEASMCWDEIPKGVFDSTKAEEIGNKLIKALTPPSPKGAKEHFKEYSKQASILDNETMFTYANMIGFAESFSTVKPIGMSDEEIDKKFYHLTNPKTSGELIFNETQTAKRKAAKWCRDNMATPEPRELPTAPDFLGLGNAWPLKDILKKLIDATDILLKEKDYDGHGWELILSAQDNAKSTVKLIEDNHMQQGGEGKEATSKIVVIGSVDSSPITEALLSKFGDVEVMTVEEAIEKGIPATPDPKQFKIERLPHDMLEVQITPEPRRKKGKGKDKMQYRGKKKKR